MPQVPTVKAYPYDYNGQLGYKTKRKKRKQLYSSTIMQFAVLHVQKNIIDGVNKVQYEVTKYMVRVIGFFDRPTIDYTYTITPYGHSEETNFTSW